MLSIYPNKVERTWLARKERPWYLRYGAAILLTCVALGLTWLFPTVRAGTPFIWFFPAVALSALYGGLRVGLFTILLSLVMISIWVLPPFGLPTLEPVRLAQLLAFLIVSTIISWLVYRVDSARLAIDEHRESLRVTLASIGDAVITTDAQANVTWMNHVGAELTGWHLDEAVGKPLEQVFRIINEQSRLPAENVVTRVLAEGRVIGLANHTLLIAKDGSEWPIEDSAAPIRDARGHIRGVVLVFHDTSARRAREKAVEIAEQRLRMALEAGRMVAWEWEIPSNRIWTTDTFAAIYGVDAIKMVEEGMQLVHPDDLTRHRATVEHAVTAAAGYHSEFRIIRPDNQEIVWIEEWATSVTGEAGEVQKLVGVAMDVTERRQAEIALQQLNATLEERVAERTAELEQVNRETVELTSVISHDLKAPLRAITTLSQWINEEDGAVLPEQAKSHLAKIRQRVGRMENLLSDLTSYARAGRVHYQRQRIDTVQLTRDIVDLLVAPSGFTVIIDEPMPVFVTERVPLETTLRHLIGNAFRHHHHPATGHVIISARDLGEWIEFCVRDDGPGIAPEYQERIFGVFQTLRPRDELEGSGMGLAIAKRLVEGRGGQISVESRPGEGCTFRFTWPK